MNEDLQNFIHRLDELLQKYNDLLTTNFDKEYLRIMKLQESKYKEKIATLETKLRITKLKLKYETNLREKSEAECEKLTETLKSMNKQNKTDAISNSTSDSNFITPANSLMSLSENELNGSNILSSNFRKHPASTPNANGDVNLQKSPEIFKIPKKNCCLVTSKLKPLDTSYLGVTKLEEKSATKYHKIPELSPIKNGSSNSITSGVNSPKKCASIKLNRNLNETFKLNTVKKICSLYFSPKKERNLVSLKSPTLNLSLENPDFSESENDISKLAPLIPPMIPTVVIHCLDEIEKRGLKEIGMYRMVGDEEGILDVQEKFENMCTDIDLSEINIHSVAAFLKRFLRNFPLIPKTFHHAFTSLISGYNGDEFYYAISSLPQANRDTLAYLMIHLRRISSSILCKMPVSRLSPIFAPIIFGLPYCSEEDHSPNQFTRVMEELFKLPSSYWNSFIVEPTNSEPPTKLRNSPSTEEIVRKKAIKFFTTPVRKKRFFSSP